MSTCWSRAYSSGIQVNILLFSCKLKTYIVSQIGGATGKIGDPSGKKTDREGIGINIIEQNIICIERQIQHIFDNHENYFWHKEGEKDKLTKLRWYLKCSD